MKKGTDAPTVEWFASLAALADALTALESQCITAGFGVVANKLRAAKVEIAAAAEIIQSQAYDELELTHDTKNGESTTTH